MTLPASVSPAALEVLASRECEGNPEKQPALVGSATVVLSPVNVFGVTRSSGTVLFEGLVAGNTVTVSGAALDGTPFTPLDVTLRPGTNRIELTQTVACLTGGASTGD